MLNDKLREKLVSLYERIKSGDLSDNGDVSKQMFLSTLDVLIADEKREADIRINFLEDEVQKLKLQINEKNTNTGRNS
jgi:hypothetical protein